ncbi:MAG: YdbH domain-containing protein [Lentisphaeria bacterium]|nr:YdbH domain-containing protein [Lentisphaeria bacterium]
MRLLSLLPPCILNILISLVFFITATRFQLALKGGSAVLATSAMAVWAAFYSLTAVVLSRRQNERNATFIIETALVLLVLDMMGFAMLGGLKMQFVWLGLSGIGCAGFFAPFQLFLKQFYSAQDENKSISLQAALYLFSWSSGYAGGNLLTAWIWGKLDPENGWKICYLITGGLILLVLLGVEFGRRWAARRLPPPESGVGADGGNMASAGAELPQKFNFLWLMVVVGVGGCLSIAVIRSPLNLHLEANSISLMSRSIVLALLTYVQALVGLSFYRSRFWPYRPWGMSLLALSGILGLLLFAWGGTLLTFSLAAVLYGIYSAGFFFYINFHSLNSGAKMARNVAIIEILVGITSLGTPLLMGMLIKNTGNTSLPLWIALGVVMPAMLLQFAFSWRFRKCFGNVAVDKVPRNFRLLWRRLAVIILLFLGVLLSFYLALPIILQKFMVQSLHKKYNLDFEIRKITPWELDLTKLKFADFGAAALTADYQVNFHFFCNDPEHCTATLLSVKSVNISGIYLLNQERRPETLPLSVKLYNINLARHRRVVSCDFEAVYQGETQRGSLKVDLTDPSGKLTVDGKISGSYRKMLYELLISELSLLNGKLSCTASGEVKYDKLLQSDFALQCDYADGVAQAELTAQPKINVPGITVPTVNAEVEFHAGNLDYELVIPLVEAWYPQLAFSVALRGDLSDIQGEIRSKYFKTLEFSVAGSRGENNYYDGSVTLYDFVPENPVEAAGFKVGGNLSLMGGMIYDNGKLETTGTISFTNGTVSNPDLHLDIKDMSLRCSSDDLIRMHTKPGQYFKIGSLNFNDFLLQNLIVRYQVQSRELITLESCNFNWANGTIFIPTLNIRPGQNDLRTTIYCEKIRFEDAFKAFGFKNVQCRGELYGKIPLYLCDRGVFFYDAFLYTIGGAPEKLNFEAPEEVRNVAAGNANMDLAYEALKNYEYTSARMNISSEADKLKINLKLSGRPLMPLPFTIDSESGTLTRSSEQTVNLQGLDLDTTYIIELNRFLLIYKYIDKLKSGGYKK